MQERAAAPSTVPPADWPPYCCAILVLADGRLLLERRPPHKAHAPRRLTCFGGTREPGESPAAALWRELAEEIGWRHDGDPGDPAVILRVDGRLTAWFWRLDFPGDPAAVVVEPGVEAVALTPTDALAHAELSSWHRAVIQAWLAGERVAEATE